MCYSFKTSLISYSLGMLSALFALCTRQYILGILILFYTQIQLSEAMIWYGIDTRRNEWNRIGTAYGKYLLPTHNIAIGLGILFLAYRNTGTPLLGPLILGILFYLYVILVEYRKKHPDSTYPGDPMCTRQDCQNDKNRLVWPFPQRWYVVSIFLSLFLLIRYIRPWSSVVFFVTLFFITFFQSLFLFRSSMSSVWCFSAAVLAPVLVVGNYFILHKTAWAGSGTVSRSTFV